MQKTIIFIAMLAILFWSVNTTGAQTIKPVENESNSCIIIPLGYNPPKEKFGNFVFLRGTFMSDKIPYDPRTPSFSNIECSKHEMNCRVSTAWVAVGGLLDLILSDYKVEKWTPDLITARFISDSLSGNFNSLVIRLSDKSVTIFHLYPQTGESSKEFLKDASNLTKDKTLQEYYFGGVINK